MAIKQFEIAAPKKEDLAVGQKWEAKRDGKTVTGTITKVRAKDVQMHWSDNSNTWSVPFSALVKKVK